MGQFLQTDPIGTKDDPNLYLYVGLDPADGRDPSGTEVSAEFYKDSGLFHVRDDDTGEEAFARGFSGGMNGLMVGGPLPDGRYAILDQRKNSAFFRLERRDEHFGDDRTRDGGQIRGEFRLHAGTRSVGCVTLCVPSQARIALGIVRNTRTSATTVDSKSRNPWAPRTEPATQYGSLVVRASGTYRYDASTGEVTQMRMVEHTGSRLPRVEIEHVCTFGKDGTCK